MVTNVTSLTGNGLKDWLIQRITSAFFAVFVVLMFAFFLTHPHCDFMTWHQLFQQAWVKVGFALAVLAYVLHAWIGIWTVTTDYLHCTALRIAVQLTVLLVLLIEFIASLLIVWG